MSIDLRTWFPEPYSPHALHLDATNDWIDANCYTDLWIELVHCLGHDPLPMLGCTLGVDFEGDQWTFVKPAQRDLWALYGLDVIELAVYRSLDAHAATQAARGTVPIIEVDAYYLPDVPANYQRAHSKTTIAVVAIDRAARTARYLHNAGCFTLSGEDYAGVFGLGGAAGGLVPYVEVVSVRRSAAADSVALALDSATRHLARRGGQSAMDRFLTGFGVEIGRLADEEPSGFDGYAFGTLRQLGAASALSARFVRWLAAATDHTRLAAVAEPLDAVSRCAKRLILKAARTVLANRPLAADAITTELAVMWQRANDQLAAALVRP